MNDLVIHLFHGRENPHVNLDDWGEDGGYHLVQGIHLTYLSHIRVLPFGADDWKDMEIHGDLIKYNGMYYGDMSVMTVDQAKKETDIILNWK